MDKISASGMRTLTFGDRSISYNEATDDPGDSVSERSDHETEYSYPSSIYPCSDMDSGVGDDREDVCCENESVETDRKVIKPDLKAIEELTNFDEVKCCHNENCSNVFSFRMMMMIVTNTLRVTKRVKISVLKMMTQTLTRKKRMFSLPMLFSTQRKCCQGGTRRRMTRA